MKRFFRPATLFWSVLALILGIVWCNLPLLETLGYEYALFSALFSALASGHLAALYPHQHPHPQRSVLFHYGQVMKSALLPPLLLLIISLINGIRVPFCNLGMGLAFFLLMPLFGTAMAAALGLIIGIASPNKTKATLFYILLFLAALGSGFYKFYATPAVFIFHPFAGYYPGVLYDRLITIDHRLITYRLTTVLQIAMLLSVAATFFDSSRLRFTPKRFSPRAKGSILAYSLLGLTVLFSYLGPHLGHRMDRPHLEAALPNHVATPHLDIYFPKEVGEPMQQALVDDAMFHLHQVIRYFGAPPTKRIAIFFFLNTTQKGILIGAKETNVAKPWRREVYVVLETPPHTILRHELVHALSADFGTGPFRVSGGLIPNPALIEGIATAAGGMRGDLSVHQWAAAMAAIDLMPPLQQLFGLGFFDLPAGVAYTAAGSFSDFVHQQYGAKALKTAYRLADFEAATAKTLSSLESDWRNYLKQIPLSAADKAVAEHRFDATPVIRTTCVHEVARISLEAEYYAGYSAHRAAQDCFDRAHEKSGGATFTYRNRFYEAINANDTDAVSKMAKHMMSGRGFTKADQALAKEVLTDLDRRYDKLEDYDRIYRELAHQSGRAKDARRLLVKSMAMGDIETLPTGFLDIFGPVPPRGGPALIRGALSIAEAARTHPHQPLYQYLLARQQTNAEHYDAALSTLSQSSSFSTLPKPLAVAARMLRGRLLFQLGQYEKADAVFTAIAEDDSQRDGDRIKAEDWAERARFKRPVSEKYRAVIP